MRVYVHRDSDRAQLLLSVLLARICLCEAGHALGRSHIAWVAGLDAVAAVPEQTELALRTPHGAVSVSVS
eukprot:12466174-Heterocapsa_arctica.AAC.1